jgi:hypothetical protein
MKIIRTKVAMKHFRSKFSGSLFNTLLSKARRIAVVAFAMNSPTDFNIIAVIGIPIRLKKMQNT